MSQVCSLPRPGHGRASVRLLAALFALLTCSQLATAAAGANPGAASDRAMRAPQLPESAAPESDQPAVEPDQAPVETQPPLASDRPAVESEQTSIAPRFSQRWQPGQILERPNPGDIVDRTQPNGMAETIVRRTWETTLSTGAAVQFCPSASRHCHERAGGFVALSLLHRPMPWFSWGLEAEGLKLEQRWELSDQRWSFAQQALSGRLLARVHLTSLDVVDPYIGLALGGGALRNAYGALHETPSTHWVGSPLYSARFGLDATLTENVRLGGMLDWTSWLASTGERCPWVVGGVCSPTSWAAFPPDNAVWKAGVELSVVFGQQL